MPILAALNCQTNGGCCCRCCHSRHNSYSRCCYCSRCCFLLLSLYVIYITFPTGRMCLPIKSIHICSYMHASSMYVCVCASLVCIFLQTSRAMHRIDQKVIIKSENENRPKRAINGKEKRIETNNNILGIHNLNLKASYTQNANAHRLNT